MKILNFLLIAIFWLCGCSCMATGDDPYTILGVDKNAEYSDIKKAYYKLSLKYHPDKNPDAQALENFQRIAAAYETLSKVEEMKQEVQKKHAAQMKEMIEKEIAKYRTGQENKAQELRAKLAKKKSQEEIEQKLDKKNLSPTKINAAVQEYANKLQGIYDSLKASKPLHSTPTPSSASPETATPQSVSANEIKKREWFIRALIVHTKNVPNVEKKYLYKTINEEFSWEQIVHFTLQTAFDSQFSTNQIGFSADLKSDAKKATKEYFKVLLTRSNTNEEIKQLIDFLEQNNFFFNYQLDSEAQSQITLLRNQIQKANSPQPQKSSLEESLSTLEKKLVDLKKKLKALSDSLTMLQDKLKS